MERKKRYMQSFVKQTLFLALIVLGAIGAWAQTTIDLSEDFTTDVITAHDGDVLTGTLSTNVKISIANNATVTLQNVSINANGGWTTGDYAGITCEGDATLILVGTNTVKGFNQDYPGIYVPGDKNNPNNNKTLTIQGSGSLKASSNGNGAGIGGGSNINCGNIVIAGGTITATGKEANAGIGVGYEASCGTISITGGTVNATGSLYGSGIGTGYGGSCGAITISGGFVTANGGGYAAGIGAGYHNASCVSIDITGGTVTATGGTKAAGIGTGQESSCGPITITNGVTQVTATKGGNAPNSIGAGWQSDCGTVTIGGVEYWKNSQYLNGGDDAQTGIVKSPYYYPIPNYTLGEIPSGWTVTANGTEVTVTPYESPNQDKGYASIPVDAEVVLTPTLSEKPRVKSVTLIDPLTIPLTFEAKTAGAEVTFTINATAAPNGVEYSTDGNTWETYTSGTAIPLTNVGDKVSFRGTNARYATTINAASIFSCSDDCYIYGNVMSLINKDNFATNTTLDVNASHSFCKLFFLNTNIYSHDTKPLLLPATILNLSCYYHMFYGCSSLTTAPALPATTLANGCYLGMFRGCNLIAAPELSATTLADNCYEDMFGGCSSLTVSPALPATTLANKCYSKMFYGCTSLTTAPVLPATTLAKECYANMFNGCSNLTQAPALPATTLAEECYFKMFYGCTSLTAAPVLPATTLAEKCYYHMFESCTHLNQVTCLATDISAQYCTENWLNNVAATGTFIKPASMNDWTLNSPDGIPVGWTAIPVVPGKFSVNADGDQIYFSQGNLQATTSDHGANWTWSFATNQWDYIGNAEANTSINGDGTVSTNGTVDLFGWVGASSTWTGAAQYGISNATTTNSTYTYGNVADEALKSDWGNNIDSSWRTLTIDEWQYLFNTRASGSTVNGTSNARYTHATINTDGTGVNGIILFPDGVTIANNEATQWGAINGTSAWGTQCTSDQWTALAAKGCVFLPAAGDRFNGTSISSAGDQGLYWSSTSYTTDSNPAYCIKFGSNSLITNESYYRFYGLSVRLVRDAN